MKVTFGPKFGHQLWTKNVDVNFNSNFRPKS